MSDFTAIASATRSVEEDPVRRRELPTKPEPFEYRGYTITHPDFTSESFAAALDRAFADGLTVTPERAPHTWRVWNPRGGSEYVCSIYSCQCSAGYHGRVCKQLALILLVEAITEAGFGTIRPP